ncbi:Anaphase-promoting complex subunit 1 [Caenorhabditis elegans]|uniref:Anaphase-promoting complex subunit 1 n=1 Tax=Caenorhabditis elegans TaxID=6239 RepID=APC1_CAEEL|nr:Anaphase-promoting complex subunit 1 [Caenorhabditis elegans]CAH2655809.1 Anaphase-promoting complex subunit 1 [Caenorhabditis elegans]
MISANKQFDIQLGDEIGKDFFTQDTVVCAFRNKEKTTDFVFTSGPIILICDGTTRRKMIKRRFKMEFDIKKVFFHSFIVTRNAEKLATENCGGPDTKHRDYLVVCGEHKLQFISLPDYHFYHYEIPFKLRNVFSCSTSLLVERFYDSSSEQTFHHHDTFHLYSLSGPFGELLPVIYKTSGYHPQWKFCWQSHRDEAGLVDAQQNYVVVYDQKEKTHRIYMARETQEQEVHAAIRYVEALRRPSDSTMFASSLAPNSAGRTTHFDPTLNSPAENVLSEVISSEIDSRSPFTPHLRSGFGHSTPNNPNAPGYPATLPTPNFEGNNDSQIWATTPNTPRVIARGGLERNIHTRTLARMVNEDAPGTSTPAAQSRLQTTASPFHRTHLTQMCRRGDTNASLLRDFTRMIRDTPRNFSKNTQHGNDRDFGDLERDPDVDLLLSKVCLECVYVEPKEGAIPKANKIFISNFLSDMYINLVSVTGEVMKIIPIWKNAETTRKNLLEKGKHEPCVVDCVDAAFVMKSGITVVLGSDFTTAMFGGNERIAPIFIKEMSNQRVGRKFRLFSFAENRIFAVNEMRCIVVEIPETVTCKSATELMRTCFLHLDRDLSRKLLIKWRSVKRDVDTERLDLDRKEMIDVAIFMLDNVGVRVTNVVAQERADSPEGHGGKQMRPRMSDSEVLSMMRQFFEEMTFRPKSEVITEDGYKCHLSVELDPNGEGFVHTQDLLHAFHSQCEDWSINTMMHSILLELIPYAYLLAKVMNYRAFEEYYVQLFKHLLSQIAIEFKIPPEIHEKFVGAIHIPKPCWSLNNVIAHIICERTTPETMESIPKFISKSSVRLLTILAVGRKFIGMGTNIDMDCERWLGKDWKRRIGLSGDILKSFRRIMNGKSSNSAGRASQLIELFEIGSITIDFMVLAVKVLMLKFQTDAFAGAQSIEPKKCIYATADEMISIAHLRWKNDIRMHNVQLMLNSSRPILIATNILRKNEDDNMKELQDRFLTQTSYRTFSQPFGRAFLDFRTAVPSLLTSIYIPRLNVGGMIYPSRVTCDPPTTEIFKLCTEWGNFYNSLASALRIGSSETVRIDNEWIVMVSKNIKSTAVIGGMTLGFGLNGHLAPFNMYHAHQMLSTFDKFHSVALLIGLSASNFTTCDVQIHKILATYLSFLMGPTPLEIKLDFTIQTAAISGLGLLFADSGNMTIAKKLVNEIGRAPNRDEEPVTDRNAYKLSAGFSLGLIMLGKGNGSASTVIPFKQNIPPMSQRLIYMMNGMRRDKCVFLPQVAPPVVNDVPNLPFSNGGMMTSSQVANHVKESEYINIHQSAEPAAIALGMMFMKMNNEFIANALALPGTITELERLKPDSMYSRVLAQCLVMWDSIEPTHDFVKSLIPPVIREYATAALHFGVPIRRDEDGEEVHEAINDAEEKYWAEIVDKGTVSQTFLYAVSAACMAIALKFSSCGGPNEKNIVNTAFRIIEYYTKIVMPDGKSNKDMGSIRMCIYSGAYTRTSCLSMLITAMAILRVGTGDLEVMRYARLLRLCDKPESDWIATGKKHFEQMVAHQALGILMLGEGRYAFKKDDLSIALTIISTFPTIPQSVSDNSHYHQPLRFLWSMAVEPRLLVPFDIAESCVVEVDVTIVMKPKDGNEPIVYKEKAPYLLPPLEDLQSISIGGGNYQLVHISLQSEDQVKVMKDIMTIGQGRVMLKRYGVDSSEMKIKEATTLYDDTPSLMSMFNNEDTAVELDEYEIQCMMEKIDEGINLNSSDEYPNVQIELSCVRDVTERTTMDLAQLQKRSLKLLSESLDLWQDEVNVSNTINGLADAVQDMQI